MSQRKNPAPPPPPHQKKKKRKKPEKIYKDYAAISESIKILEKKSAKLYYSEKLLKLATLLHSSDPLKKITFNKLGKNRKQIQYVFFVIVRIEQTSI